MSEQKTRGIEGIEGDEIGVEDARQQPDEPVGSEPEESEDGSRDENEPTLDDIASAVDLSPNALADGTATREPVYLKNPSTGKTFKVLVRRLRYSEERHVQKVLSSYLEVSLDADEEGIERATRRQNAKGRAKNREADEVVAIEDEEGGTKAHIRFNSSKRVEATYDARLLAAAYGTIDDRWTREKIEALWPSDWIKKVGDKVMEITGIGSASEQVQNFRRSRAK